MVRNTADGQNLSAKIAEFKQVPFRGHLLKDENLILIHRGRANAMLTEVQALTEKVTFNPFLEIGAGCIQRSAALINNYSIDGVATDIAQRLLQDAPYTLSLLNYKRTPTLICCDAHHLPFLSNTFMFVTAFQMLHRFTDPAPVIAECYRVLGKGGYFYFNEEPVDSSLRRLLRGKRALSRPRTRLQSLAHSLGVERIFWDDGARERSAGIIVERFNMVLWRRALRPFAEVDAEINRKLKIHIDLKESNLSSSLASLVGGNIKGLCLKSEGEAVIQDFHKRLMCLDCRSAQISQAEDTHLCCEGCGRIYPITEGVIRMLPKELETQLSRQTQAAD
jgi:SAM-dependent methyltransferase